MNICKGGWLLEPNGDDSTRATYVIYTDSGGAIPPFIANNGSRVAIRKVFEAIRKQVTDPSTPLLLRMWAKCGTAARSSSASQRDGARARPDGQPRERAN